MSKTIKIIHDGKGGVKRVGPMAAGVVYELTDEKEVERLKSVKGFREATSEELKRFTVRSEQPVEYETHDRQEKAGKVVAGKPRKVTAYALNEPLPGGTAAGPPGQGGESGTGEENASEEDKS